MARSVKADLCGDFAALEASGLIIAGRAPVPQWILARRYGVSVGFVSWLGYLAFAKRRAAEAMIRRELKARRLACDSKTRLELFALETLSEVMERKHLEIVLVYAQTGSFKRTEKLTGRTRKTVAAALRKLRE